MPGSRNRSRGHSCEQRAWGDCAVEGGLGNGVSKWKHCCPAINSLQLLRGYIPPNQSTCISKLAAVNITGLRSVWCVLRHRCVCREERTPVRTATPAPCRAPVSRGARGLHRFSSAPLAPPLRFSQNVKFQLRISLIRLINMYWQGVILLILYSCMFFVYIS